MSERSSLAVWLPPLLSFVIGLSSWELGVHLLQVPKFLLPAPSSIARAVFDSRELLLGSLSTTAKGACAGFGLSLVFGTAAGVVLSLSRWVERAFYPYALFLQTVPIVAIAPLLVLWFGPGLRAVSVSAFIVSVFPIIASTLAGLRGVDPALVEVFALYRAKTRHNVLWLRLPSAIPSMATGWKVAAGLSVIGAIVGEFVAGFAEGQAGLGITVLAAYRHLRTDLMFGAVLLAAFLGLLLFGAVTAIGDHLLRRLRVGGEQSVAKTPRAA